MEQADLERRVGRVEDRIALYEPLLQALGGVPALADSVGRLEADLRTVRESWVATQERIGVLLSSRSKGDEQLTKMVEEKLHASEKEILRCPINEVVKKVDALCLDVAGLGSLRAEVAKVETQIGKVETQIDTFQNKGWELIFRLLPWVVTVLSLAYAFVGVKPGP